MKFISNSGLITLLNSLKEEYEVYIPVKKGDQRFYRKFDSYSEDNDGMTVGEVRAFEPLKAFFSPAREKVADGFKPDVPAGGNKPFAIVGVKACDLKGFKVQDFVFRNEDFTDPFYSALRERNLIISSDCTTAIGTCFCRAVGIQPYPQEDFDLNLSTVTGGFIVTAGSDKGKSLVEKQKPLFQDVDSRLQAELKEQRDRVTAEVDTNIANEDVPDQARYKDIIEKNFESGIWEDEAKTCVECGACNTVCPTCHCFFLYDQKEGEHMARFRAWDSCMIKDFARVAGGANPRSHLWMRLRNRFEKKFDFFPKVADVYACTGCGRCISACPAKIDIRKVLKKLVSNA